MSLQHLTVLKSKNKEIVSKWMNKHLTDLVNVSSNLEEELIQDYQDRYVEQSFFKIESLIRNNLVQSLRTLAYHLPAREVYVSDDRTKTWKEYKFSKNQNILETLFFTDPLDRLLESIRLPKDRVTHTEGWLNRYRTGEYIPEHTDTSGDHQILLGLQTPHPGTSEGQLFVDGKRLQLGAGDVLVFKAHELRHRTKPVKNEEVPDRVNAVLRIYESENSRE